MGNFAAWGYLGGPTSFRLFTDENFSLVGNHALHQEAAVSETCKKSDLAGSKLACLLWGLPIGMLAVGALWPLGRPWLWTPALLIAGIACIANASRCGRVHCYLTGPLYLVGSMASLLRAFHFVPIAWHWIGFGVIGGTILAFIPEWLRGKYMR